MSHKSQRLVQTRAEGKDHVETNYSQSRQSPLPGLVVYSPCENYLDIRIPRYLYLQNIYTLDNHIQRIQLHDKEAFEKVFHKYYNGLCHFAMRFVSNRDDAEEVVQDTFVKLWERRIQLNIHHSLKSYLYQSVRNNCLNRVKHQVVVREYEAFFQIHGDTEINEDLLITTELEQRIRESIQRLPPERKRIFLMSRDEGMPYSKIASALGLSVKTVENQIGRALKFLREELADFLVVLCLLYLNNFGGWG